ncbi:MAG: TerB family tellurite resistance protein [Bacteroidetes bacterium]|nr:MAG: TerB family tellurite resistance protein [Bacteroidota bacterium]
MNLPKFTYNQAVFGLMLLGAKADGKLQDEEKRLLVELTSEEHHLTAEEYKLVISEAKNLDDESFAQAVYETLNSHSPFERVKALYWLLQVINSDRSSDATDAENNEQESRVYNKALDALGIEIDDVKQYEKSRI